MRDERVVDGPNHVGDQRRGAHRVEVDVDGVKYKLSEDDARARMLMPRKSRRLFDAMQRGIAVKQNKAKQLRERKSQTAGAGAKASKRR